MHVDVRELENNSLIEGDLCIIGAGAAGISMALEWEGRQEKVILLEGGGFDVEYEMQDLYAGESVGQPYFPLLSSRLHYFGGTTGHWAGWSSPLDPQDFVKRDWVPYSGWPFTFETLLPFYERTCSILELVHNTFEPDFYLGQYSNLKKLPFDDSVIFTKMWQLSPPTRFGKFYRDTIVNSKNIHLHTYANVCDIEANEEVSAIRQLTVRTHEGKEHTVRARNFVLAGGAIQNARILLASNKQASQGIGNDHDLVGRFFMEHLEVVCALFVLEQPDPLNMYTVEMGKTRHFGELALTPEKQEALQILNGTSSFRGQPSSNTRRGFAGFSSDAVANVRAREARQRNDDPTEDAETKPAMSNFVMQVRMEQAPNPDSRVMLSEEQDALGVPRTKLDWRLTEFDKRSIRQMYETIGTEAGRLGIGRVQLEDWLVTDDPMWPSTLGAGWHHMGTTRMHEDPKQGVVDPNCKVHGIANLYVAGSAVYPTSGAANPTLTLIAMTLRLSDHLKSQS